MATLTTACLLLVVASAALATDFINCNNGVPFKSLSITGCDNGLPICAFITDETYVVNVTFVTDREVTSPKPTLILVPQGGDPVQPPLGDDACPIIVTGCPVQPGTDALLSFPIKVSGNHLGAYTSEFRLDDKNGNIACGIVEILIV